MTFSKRGNNNFSGGQNYARRDFGDRGSDRPAMFDAVCAQCGSACKVPFKPNGRKEVFCSKCFENNGGGSREASFGDSRRPQMYDKRGGGPGFADRQMFRATCDQCGQGCEVPFRPTNGKPVLCSNCFADTKSDFSRTNERPNVKPSVPGKDYSIEIEQINTKLDRILKLLSPTTTKEASKEVTNKILTEIEANLAITPSVTKRKRKKPVVK
ncbi:hypothetical protein A3K29_04120 [Candidatus Collierbacteria bacterium RIFOXYB2_FULL_46_14]|uniref:CxxC-x17-CxxC domain-containing protein n=1 Tax=Candidatus Collierbacteria bacterium GW2011_GWA2_46_26 TaxID=1618381 RepID=A0A0G1PLA7_9BACT|nr:MAG: hypothetical protein UW29_C0002G0010 [Candidatus Collierbacteria bacterium GW2011_GWC2_44_13]KKU33487.1 MAG: hypothetical protein UX47_C0003G0010 [Candidatus Collierbacteria bacterium GW2011_GWA2_46_26]OGD73290.1 MAG: hypothetical protein A3K29_04120 [Candidatus Collierbacteria bacterium RIFOXYB2_FULL_46_14]OGD76332.1 MAG: hypothetical protein A3K43_04120 [Candidatus Collierbacteria bacterium RIFOXYA2_FULL_46_20]OGD77668.1 MAG: hypothetical protein A3K39_04120 [Candidatus Collierbacteri